MSYAYKKPNYFELFLIALAALLQPIIELNFDSRIATYYNIVAASIIGLYIAMVIWKTKGSVLRQWGMRWDNFWKVIPVYLIFTAVACAIVFVQNYFLGNNVLPFSFWYLLLLYPLWGFAQQFALQNLVVQNLASLVPSITARALVVTLLFGVVHLPSIALCIEAGLIGFFFVLLYDRFTNLYAIGIAHGIIGSLVFHLILGQNQWEILMGYMK